MDRDQFLKERFGISGEALTIVDRCEQELGHDFSRIDETSELNSYKVLDAFRSSQVSARHFNPSNGYGYGDEGRDKLSEVYAKVFGAEDAIVSPLFMSGTHTISAALFGLLRPGDRVICVTGTVYDTLQSVISGSIGSLEEFGISFEVVPLAPDGSVDLKEAKAAIEEGKPPALVYLQRSTGYDIRPAFTTTQLGDAIGALRAACPNAVYMVDNCYGEFVCEREPTEAGADIIAGSLIKNPGGGLAPTGGYIAGRRDLVERIAARYAAPGIGREVGSYAYGYQYLYQGLFMAPHAVGQALRGVTLASAVFGSQGYDVSPGPHDARGDITQVILLENRDLLTAFVRGIQKASAVDAHVVPYAWDMPGYEDQVIMAAGTFVQGASLELTADGPMRPPYAAYLQGGLMYAHARLGVLCALQACMKCA